LLGRFGSEPYKFEAQKGSMITAARAIHLQTLDIHLFKKKVILNWLRPYSDTFFNMFSRKRPTYQTSYYNPTNKQQVF
jgi:hypothetical protein